MADARVPSLLAGMALLVACSGGSEPHHVDHAAPDAHVEIDAGSNIDAGPSPDAGITIPTPTVDQSLVFTDPVLLDDATVIGLGRLMETVCPSSPGLALFDWMYAFNRTAHSERAGPALLVDEVVAQHGPEPAMWPLDTLPFKVTGIHNRIDLSDDGHCGELRVSMASVHPIYRPLHFIWLYRMPGPDCAPLAREWAGLGELRDEAHREALTALLDRFITAETFIMAESVEFTVAPWEWRQWQFNACVPTNPPLFQQVDVEGLNVPGGRRERFLRFIEDNADGLASRTTLIPEEFRAPSVRVNQGIPWVPLDLDGLDPVVAASHPELRQQIEMVGCAGCHVADAPFVQTHEDRTFSPFYRKELDARLLWLTRLARGEVLRAPFGPLQEGFVLPP